MLRVANLSYGADLAGVGYRYSAAAARVGDELGVSIRAVRRKDNWLRYPADLSYDDPESRRVVAEADVLHHNKRARASKTPGVIEFHGSELRRSPRTRLREATRLRLVAGVSTLDLEEYAPDALSWLPAPYNLDELAAIQARAPRRDNDVVRILSAPTNRTVKSTELLVQAVAALRAEKLPVELELVERTGWAECLARKASADIVFDQIVLGYGCNAVEAWGMSIPVVAGASDYTLGRYVEEAGRVPFALATRRSLVDVLRTLVRSADLRAEYGAIGRAYAERFHAETPALERALDLYRRAVTARRRPR